MLTYRELTEVISILKKTTEIQKYVFIKSRSADGKRSLKNGPTNAVINQLIFRIFKSLLQLV